MLVGRDRSGLDHSVFDGTNQSVVSMLQIRVSSMVQIRVNSGIEFRQFIIGGWLGVALATLW